MVHDSLIVRQCCLLALTACLLVGNYAHSQQPPVRSLPNPVPEPLVPGKVPAPAPSVEVDEFALPDVLNPSPGGYQRLGPDFSNPSGVPAQQAINRSTSPQPQGDYNVRLAQTPKMLGDFFSNTNSCIQVGQHYGMVVHQTIGSGSSGAADHLRVVAFDSGSGNWEFKNGPASTNAGTFFSPAFSSLPNGTITGLSGNGLDGSGNFTAVASGEQLDVFDNGSDASPTLNAASVFDVFEVSKLVLPAANPGDLVGRVRMQDNNSAMPQDRVYLDYNYFHNARYTSKGLDVNRIAPGFERTFASGLGSVEFRMPVAATLDSETTFGDGFNTSHVEFGNLTISPKLLLWADEQQALAVGLGIALPTADDLEVFATNGQVLEVRNDAVHLVPYLGYLYSPQRSDFFVHSFLTLDVDTGGNDVWANVTGDGLQEIGIINDQTLLSASAAVGKFVFRNTHRNPRIRSLAWSTELHYTTTISDADVVQAGAFQLGSPNADLSLLNGTVGGHLQLQNSVVTAGYTVPLTSADRVFDGELRVFINRPF